ncbi:MAG: protease [Caldithrix sp.]|nr:MAG: protease [Caldithrix sp.]
MRRFLMISVLLVATICFAQGQKGYYRFPAIHRGTMIFTAESDLWRVGIEGGMAQRLTTHHDIESHAAISPDGQTIAFVARYEGPTEVYTMPVNGGLPQRQTFDGEQAAVRGWTPEGDILYMTRHFTTLPNAQLARINPKDHSVTLIPLNQASDGSFEASGKTLFFTRLPFQGSRTKRYHGGTAQNIWKFTFGTREAVPLTATYTGTSKTPMWWNDRVYFASDRDGSMNIWSMAEDGSDVTQHTFHKGWDVQSPALHDGKIVYQLGADLHLFDNLTNTEKKIDISLASDFDQTREKWIKKPMDYLSDIHISEEGKKIALTSRGRIFVAPVKDGRFVEISPKEGVRFRNALFLPENNSLLLLSDESGEQEFWQFQIDGSGKGTQLTTDAKVLRYEGTPSPDGKKFAFTDKDQKLWVYDFTSKKASIIETSEWFNNYDLVWSPDSKWLAYVGNVENLNSRIKLYNTITRKITFVTSDRVDSYSPAWGADGKWLYFLSDRHFESLVRSPWGPRQPEPFFSNTTKIYALSLRKGERFPFLPQDETMKSEEEKKENKEEKKDEEKKDKSSELVVSIDLNGIEKRIFEVPVDAGNYARLKVTEKRLFWTEAETSIERKRNLLAIDIDNDDPETITISEDIRSYDLSGDGKKLLVRKDNNIYVTKSSADASAKLDDDKVKLSNWTFSVKPRDEWRQMFLDAWRLERDYFYDRNLHGLDWQELLNRHLPLVNRVTDRAELDDLIAQLVGELSALHIFVGGGDYRKGDDNINPAALGATLKRDEKAGGYRIEHIYQSEPDYPDRQSPLSRPDLNINKGDIILSVDGISTLSVVHPRLLLRNKSGEQVILKMKSKTTGKAFDVVIEPISARQEADLRYDEWEYTRRLEVDKMSRNEIGYVHMRAMGGKNFSEFVRNFYPVFNRQGLIIDMRHNRGGNIDSWVLEKLLRKAWFYWQPRVGKPYWNMQYAFRGHMVVLCNEMTASDGEAFTEGFRRLGLGKVIGTRTWGGEIWLSFNNRLVDRGIASAAQTGVYGPEGKWLIEGWGVDPDIVVDNLPHETFNGKDAQLEAAVKHLQELIAKDPRPVPPAPPYPNKRFDYEKMTNGKQ